MIPQFFFDLLEVDNGLIKQSIEDIVCLSDLKLCFYYLTFCKNYIKPYYVHYRKL